MTPNVIDIYHGDNITSFNDLANSGIWGVIHKASQGSLVTDSAYASRRQQALAAGLLFGAYHFNTGEDVAAQVNNFINAAEPDDNTLMALDFEDNTNSEMSIQQAVEFMKLLESKINRECVLYSGNKLKENIDQLSDNDKAYVQSRRLWLCEYGSTAKLPEGYSNYWLWQYTGDGVGPVPHTVNGATGNMDLNVYNGTLDQLKSEWAGNSLGSPQVPQNTQAPQLPLINDTEPNLDLADTSGNMFTPVENEIKSLF